jgi:class 3 adenylate cyclase/streptogramin lyase
MPRGTKAAQRLLTTVLFTDIVGSTKRAAEVGDRRWRQIVSAHHALVRRELKRSGGREIDTAGDGFFAIFDQPAQAIRCAEAVAAGVRRLGIEIRAGIHMGEVEVIGPKVGGIAVHIGARVMSKAEPSQVLVSSTVRDLMAGSDLKFEDLGSHELKGVPAQWRLYAVEQPEASPVDATPVLVEERAGRRPVPWVPVLIAVVLLAVLVAVPIVVTLRGGRSTNGLSGPAADSVVRVDPAGRVLGGVAVGRQPGAVAVDGNTVWVANFNDGTIQSIDATTNVASPAIALGISVAPRAIAVGGGYVWVLSSTPTAELYRIDPTQAHSGTPFALPEGVRGLAFGDGAVWVTSNFDGKLLRIDVRNPAGTPQVADLGADSGPEGVVFGGGAVWVAEGLKGEVARVDPVTMKVTTTVPLLKGDPAQLAFGEGYVWATVPRDNSVTRIDPSANQGSSIPDVGNDPAGVAVGHGAVWVANADDGTVARIDPRTSTVTKIVVLSGLSAEAVAVTSTAVWVTLHAR